MTPGEEVKERAKGLLYLWMDGFSVRTSFTVIIGFLHEISQEMSKLLIGIVMQMAFSFVGLTAIERLRTTKTTR